MDPKQNAAAPAYPCMPPLDPNTTQSANGYPWPAEGFTKREAIAVAAMQAMIGTAAAPVLFGFQGAEKDVAVAAGRMADAMLDELAKERTP